MNLDIEKVEKLYYTVAKSQYGYSDAEDTYYKLTVALERMKSCVSVINEIALKGEWNKDAVDFILWINYIDLLIAAIERVATQFGYDIRYENEFYKYHNVEGKNDKDFFRFIRAIVLPHALSLDNKEQKVFTNGKTAFSPFVVWDTDNCVRIVFYNSDLHNDLHTYKIRIDDIEVFVERVYIQIDDLCSIVEKRKKVLKNRAKGNLKNEKYGLCNSVYDKCSFLKNLTYKYGDLNDKAGTSFDMHMLVRCEKICSMKFYGRNKELQEAYLRAMEIALDDYYQYMCEQRTDEKYLDFVLFPQFSYNSYTSFSGLGYPINKIVTEMENFDSYFKKYNFPELFEELRTEISLRASFRKNMSVERLCIIVLMVQFFDKLEKDPKYEELREKYNHKVNTNNDITQ